MALNLDNMTTEPMELFAWSHTFGHATKAQRIEVFGQTGKGTVRALKDLANYAANKATAMQCRARRDISTAQMYERIAEKIYIGLPPFAKW